MIASTPRALSSSTLCERYGSPVGRAGRTSTLVTAPSSASGENSRFTWRRTFSSRKLKIFSGALRSIAGVNTSVCHGFTATSARWMKGSSEANRKKSGARLPLAQVGL